KRYGGGPQPASSPTRCRRPAWCHLPAPTHRIPRIFCRKRGAGTGTKGSTCTRRLVQTVAHQALISKLEKPQFHTGVWVLQKKSPAHCRGFSNLLTSSGTYTS